MLFDWYPTLTLLKRNILHVYRQYFGRNFDKFRRFTIFCTNHPDNLYACYLSSCCLF